MSLNEFKQIVFGKSIFEADILPDFYEVVSFRTPGTVIEGALVIDTDYDGDEPYVYVEYLYRSYDGYARLGTSWIPVSEVL